MNWTCRSEWSEGDSSILWGTNQMSCNFCAPVATWIVVNSISVLLTDHHLIRVENLGCIQNWRWYASPSPPTTIATFKSRVKGDYRVFGSTFEINFNALNKHRAGYFIGHSIPRQNSSVSTLNDKSAPQNNKSAVREKLKNTRLPSKFRQNNKKGNSWFILGRILFGNDFGDCG